MFYSVASVAAFAAVTLFVWVQGQTYPRLEHWRQGQGTHALENNSFVDRTHIAEGRDDILRCVTNNPTCCSGNWFDDRGQLVPSRDSNTNSSFYTTTPGVVDGRSVYGLKYREGGNTVVGVFQCDIPDLYGVMKSLYVYIGSETIGKSVGFSGYEKLMFFR